MKKWKYKWTQISEFPMNTNCKQGFTQVEDATPQTDPMHYQVYLDFLYKAWTFL